MSTNKTQNYNLHSWVPEDDFIRSEFNENFTGIDTALKTLADGLAAETSARTSAVTAEKTAREQAVAAEKTAREQAVAAETTARKQAVTAEQNARVAAINALTASKAELVFGTYTGNSTNTSFDQTISLGFTPKAVLILDEHGRASYSSYGDLQVYGGLILPGHPIQGRDTGYIAAEIVTGGFAVHNYRASTNITNALYFYIAVK